MNKFPLVEQDATFFAVTRNGLELGTFSAYQIREQFADDTDGEFEFEFDQDFTIED